MDAEHDQHRSEEAEQAELNDFGKITYQFLKFGQNATNNLSQMFNDMTAKEWIRLVIVVGSYLLLRPYVQKYFSKKQVEAMEKADAKEKAEALEKAKISPNDLRGVKSNKDVADDSDDEAETSGAAWGQKARTRQRVMLKQMLEAEERRKQEEEEDKEIEDLLED
ncbi:Processing of GAS1 and ALP protein-like protein [Hapsidospora chrysogenum ATCC 11550]|uniref:Processing of GAS1 and ALP protein-like protein n=1 Tax=Hapsidospora chrysogenum (strain ATCC 11550 / CBS 779.69 / DSM 880 / IAM 14645 / JCM 23072 / IMI 49137) TaxID=857340 RepID=A0A086TE01_HAPC1|nr:Processing of GAS1 and ALP protein-like protein [Hapsidospora chrysogenum ATCC 11550]